MAARRTEQTAELHARVTARAESIRRQALELFGLHDGAEADGSVALSVAAVEAFAERGYHATTTRDIANRVGLSPAAVYVHYKTKEELLYRIMSSGHERILHAAQQAVLAEHGHERRLQAFVSSFTFWHGEQYALARVVQDELDALTEEHFERIATVRADIEALLSGLISDGVAAGVFDVDDVAATTLAILSLSIDVARWYPRATGRTPQQIADHYAELALRMVQSRRAAPSGQDAPAVRPRPARGTVVGRN